MQQHNNSNGASSSINNHSNHVHHSNNFVHFETTPREYYDHCTTATPNYDLYPSLSRRLVNGYHNKPPPPPSLKCNHRRDRQINFVTMNMIQKERTTSNTWYHPHPMFDLFTRLPPDDEQQHHDNNEDDQQIPPWDLYPLVLRNVENFGTEQMRQRLHHAMTMV